MITVFMAALAGELSAQQRPWSGGPGVVLASAGGTMGDYLSSGIGLVITLRRGDGPIALRGDWLSASFGDRAVTRQLNGSGPPLGLRSSAKVLLASAGPEAAWRRGRWRFSVAGQGGAAHVQATGRTVLPGDPLLLVRSSSHATLTWVARAGIGASVRAGRSVRIGLDASVLQLGKTKFLREYNLPIGVISGIYLNPTPYAPRFTAASLTVTLPM